jgi:cold shock CspA family protein
MINIENQNIGTSAPMNTEFENVLCTGLRELKDRNLPEVMRGETSRQVMKTTTTPSAGQPVPTGPRMSGIVKWFNPTKGFGFITPSNGGLDVFVHQSEIQLPGFRSLAQGEPVEYQLYDGQKGPKALKVTGPQGKQVKGAPRQTKAKPEKSATAPDPTKVAPGLIKLASYNIQMANQIPVSTPVLAPTQALNALPSMISTPTPGASPQISHFIVTQPGLQNYYTTTPEIPSWTTASEIPIATAMPMSPTPMMIESMPMSPQPQYIPFNLSSLPGTPTPFAYPNQIKQNPMPMNLVNSPPPAMDYSYQMAPYMQQENPYDQTPTSFIDESSHMQLTSPMSPIHC